MLPEEDQFAKGTCLVYGEVDGHCYHKRAIKSCRSRAQPPGHAIINTARPPLGFAAAAVCRRVLAGRK